MTAVANHSSTSASARPPGPPPPSRGAPSIGLNLRVTGYCNQGGRKYMEDVFSVAYQQTEDEKDLEYAFFGIFDGHGGREAAVFAKEHLMDYIVRQKCFWADDDESVLRAIHEGFVQTHQAMWKELEKWPKTASGLPSTAGTTASIAFIRRGKIYVGHVGDSAIVLGTQESNDDSSWSCRPLTRDHKPESQEESRRIAESGGKVICKSGVPRVVWNRPRMGHRGPVRRSTHIDEIPFLAVARSLGDLWSYNSEEDVFVVSPEPDTFVYPIDISKHRCLILGTDGAWNMLTASQAVKIVSEAEKSNEQHMLNPSPNRQWINPSKKLVDRAIENWNGNNLRADNTSVVTVMLDPPGPPRAQVLKRQRELAQLASGSASAGGDASPGHHHPSFSAAASSKVINADRGSVALVTNTTPEEPEPSFAHRQQMASSSSMTSSSSTSSTSSSTSSQPPAHPQEKPPGVSIISRFPNSKNVDEAQGHNLVEASEIAAAASGASIGDRGMQLSRRRHQHQAAEASLNRLSNSTAVVDSTTSGSFLKKQHPPPEQSSSPTLLSPSSPASPQPSDDDIQCNVVSSSDDDSPARKSSSTAVLRATRVKKTFTRLSRELSALQLDSPKAVDRLQRTRSSGVILEEPSSCRLLRSAKKKKDVEQKCKSLNERIRSMERKVVRKAEQLNKEVKLLQNTLASTKEKQHQQQQHFLRSSSTPTMARSLRPRVHVKQAERIPQSLSRKRKSSPHLSSPCEVVSKSPKTTILKTPKTAILPSSRPIVTRSRTARVKQLRR